MSCDFELEVGGGGQEIELTCPTFCMEYDTQGLDDDTWEFGRIWVSWGITYSFQVIYHQRAAHVCYDKRHC